jgi:hypothetical protein
MLNIWLLLLWPLSLLGILIQAGSEEQLLGSKFGHAYRRYAGRTGQLIPRLWGGASTRCCTRPRRGGAAAAAAAIAKAIKAAGAIVSVPHRS